MRCRIEKWFLPALVCSGMKKWRPLAAGWHHSRPVCFPETFLFWDNGGFHWLYMYQDGMAVPEEFDLIDFRGGLYAVATGIDQQTDREAMEREPELGNIITSPRAKAVMGYEQMNYYTPVEGRE
jgi:AraC family transcriptional regulator